MLKTTVAALIALICMHTGQAADRKWSTLDGAAPLVIAHRGASGHRPEHTLASYQLAIEMGADYIEPDLVATKDGHLIARHEPLLDDTTDVKSRPEFAARKSTKVLDGKSIEGFFASDFTLAEIKQLRAVQSNPARSKEYDARFEIPTFDEILELRARESAKHKREIGVYPETKHPSFHLDLGLALEPALLAALARHKLDHADAPVFIQSFESANLQFLRTKTRLPLVQLIDDGGIRYDAAGVRVVGVSIPQYSDTRGASPPQSLADIAKYANAIGPWKRQILREREGAPLLKTTLVEQAHAARLRVHPYTFRNEATTLAPEYSNDALKEYEAFFEVGVDGVFTDFPDTAVNARALRSAR